MDPQFKTSFIPKQPITAAPRRSKGTAVGFFYLLGLIVFIASLALAGGLTFWKFYLERSIATKDQELAELQASFNVREIEALKRLGRRMEAGGEILESHVALSPFFELLESLTLQDVQFSEFSFGRLMGGAAGVEMTGRGKSFSAVALQSDLFGKSEYIEDPIFSDLALDESGNVVFTVAATLSPDLLSYGRSAPAPREEDPDLSSTEAGEIETLDALDELEEIESLLDEAEGDAITP